jgi:peptidoglycan/xylan/chitin deacetylase (PgdA/CDA1 family)
MKLVQCWDDGVTTDARLTDLLRRHGAKATFNLNAGLYAQERQPGWVYQGTPVWRLGWREMKPVYAGFAIANHSLTHPHLDSLAAADLQLEVADGRRRLQDFFGQPVAGFVYPFGSTSPAVEDAVRHAGHLYARTTQAVAQAWPVARAMALHPNCHFQAADFWQRYAQARTCGVFYFWGHSYQMTTEAHWAALDATLLRLGADPQAQWCEVAELFSGAAVQPNR